MSDQNLTRLQHIISDIMRVGVALSAVALATGRKRAGDPLLHFTRKLSAGHDAPVGFLWQSDAVPLRSAGEP